MVADEGAAQVRWRRIWSHREQLLKVARRRSMSMEDAEDAVHEAMVRGMENPHVDDERLGAWLTTVTMRLCVDRYRQVSRDAEVHTRSTFAVPEPVGVEEAVCDRAEARWLTVRSGELPARQAEALRLKAEDLDVGEVAHHMGLSYEAVESLLARARRTLRNSLATTLGMAVWLWARRPRTGGGTTQAVTLTSAAVTVAVLGFALPNQDAPAPTRPPGGSIPEAVSGSADAGADEPPGPVPSPPPMTVAAQRDAAPAPERATELTDLVPLVLGVPLPQLPALTDVTGVPGVAEVLNAPVAGSTSSGGLDVPLPASGSSPRSEPPGLPGHFGSSGSSGASGSPLPDESSLLPSVSSLPTLPGLPSLPTQPSPPPRSATPDGLPPP